MKILGHICNQDPEPDQRPVKVAKNLQDRHEQILRVARRIFKLGPWVLSVAGQSELQRAVDAARADPEAMVVTFEWSGTVPKDEWSGWGLADHLNRLDRAIEKPIEVLTRTASGLTPGPGAPPNSVARRVALAAAKVLIDITGKPVTYWHEATAFAKLTAELFRELKGKPNARRACDRAVSDLKKKS